MSIARDAASLAVVAHEIITDELSLTQPDPAIDISAGVIVEISEIGTPYSSGLRIGATQPIESAGKFIASIDVVPVGEEAVTFIATGGTGAFIVEEITKDTPVNKPVEVTFTGTGGSIIADVATVGVDLFPDALFPNVTFPGSLFPGGHEISGDLLFPDRLFTGTQFPPGLFVEGIEAPEDQDIEIVWPPRGVTTSENATSLAIAARSAVIDELPLAAFNIEGISAGVIVTTDNNDIASSSTELQISTLDLVDNAGSFIATVEKFHPNVTALETLLPPYLVGADGESLQWEWIPPADVAEGETVKYNFRYREVSAGVGAALGTASHWITSLDTTLQSKRVFGATVATPCGDVTIASLEADLGIDLPDITGAIASIGAAINKAINDAIRGVLDTIDAIEDAIEAIYDAVRGAIDAAINSVITAAKTAINNAIETVLDGVREIASAILDDVKAAVRDAVNSAIDAVLDSEIYDAIKTTVQDAIRSAISGAFNATSSIDTAIGDVVGSIVEAVSNAIDSVLSGTSDSAIGTAISNALDTASGIYETIRDAISGILDTAGVIEDAVSSAISGTLDTISAVSSAVRDAITDAINTALETAGTIYDVIQAEISKIVTAVGNAVTAAISTIDAAITSAMNILLNAIDTVGTIIDTIVDAITDAVDAAKALVRAALDAFNDLVDSPCEILERTELDYTGETLYEAQVQAFTTDDAGNVTATSDWSASSLPIKLHKDGPNNDGDLTIQIPIDGSDDGSGGIVDIVMDAVTGVHKLVNEAGEEIQGRVSLPDNTEASHVVFDKNGKAVFVKDGFVVKPDSPPIANIPAIKQLAEAFKPDTAENMGRFRAVSRKGDNSTGHGCFPSRPSIQGSPNVFVNHIPVHRKGDAWAAHGCSTCAPHGGALLEGSETVEANERRDGPKEVARVGDPITCGDYVAEGSPNIFCDGDD